MIRRIRSYSLFLFAMTVLLTMPTGTLAAARISAADYSAGEAITIEGEITPGQELYVTVASQMTFAPKDTTGPHEVKRFKKDGQKFGFSDDTRVPVLYYLLTTTPDKFGKAGKKKFGGPSFMGGIYSTTMFKLTKFDEIDANARAMLGPIKTKDQWAFFKYLHEKTYGINTVVKEGSTRGKIVIFARSVMGDHETTKAYWDKGTSVKPDKTTGKFTVSAPKAPLRWVRTGSGFDTGCRHTDCLDQIIKISTPAVNNRYSRCCDWLQRCKNLDLFE